MYKVGDRVRIIEKLEVFNFYDSPVKILHGMLKYAGMNTEITEIFDDGTYGVSCDNGDWYWPEKTLQKAE